MSKNIFVGRIQELNELSNLVKESDNSLGKVVLIQGDPGSGKSTLVRKFNSQFENNSNYIISQSECVDKEGINAYLPFKEILIEINADAISGKSAESKKTTIDKLKSFINDSGTKWIGLIPVVGNFAEVGIETYMSFKQHFGKKESEEIKGETDIQQSFEKEFRRHAQKKTLIIFIDDLQWADNASLNLLFSLSRSIRKNPFRILLIGTYRPNDIKIGRNKISETGENIILRHPLADKINELRNYTKDDIDNSRTDKWFHEISVPTFSGNDIKSLVNSKFPNNKFSPDFYSKLSELTQGHALFVSEILQSLVEREIIYLDSSNFYNVKSLELNQLPTSINGIISERIERLDKELRKIISYASIDGEQVTIQVLEKLLKIDELDLLDSIEELSKKHGLLEESEPLRLSNKLLDLYYFTHTLVHKYVYENLDATRRRALHRRLAEVLKEIYGDDINKYADIKSRYDLHNQIGQGLIDGITLKLSNFNEVNQNIETNQNSESILFETIKNELEAARTNFEQFAILECIDHADKALAFILQTKPTSEINNLKLEILKIKVDALHWKGFYKQAFENSEKLLALATEINNPEQLAKAYSLKAKCYEALGDYDNAITGYSKSIEISKNINETDFADNLNNLGYVMVRFGKYEEAIQKFETALQIFENHKNEIKIAESLKNIGYAYRMFGDYDKGIKQYGKALLIFERLNIKRSISDCYNAIGLCFNWKGDYQKSITFFEKCLEIDNQINDNVNKANHLNNIGLAKENLGDFAGAIDFYLRTLEIDESLGDKVKIAISYSNIGSCYTREGVSFSKALDYLENALKIYEDLNDKVNIAYSYQNIGEVYRLQYEADMAYEYFMKSLKINQEIGDIKSITGDYINIANVYSLKGEHSKSIEYYNKTVPHFIDLNDKVNLAIIYNNLSTAHRMLDDYEKATEYINKSLEINISTNDKLALKRNYDILGSIHLDLDENDKALEVYKKALQISQELQSSADISFCYSKIGNIYAKLSENQTAIDFITKAAEINNIDGNFENLIYNYNDIADIYTDNENFEKAAEFYNKSLNLSEKYNLNSLKAAAYNNIGFVLYKAGKIEEAIKYYNSALENYTELNDNSGIIRNYRNLAYCYEDLNYFEDAIKFQKLIADNFLNMNDNEQLADIYHAIGVLNYKANNDDEALDYYFSAFDIYKAADNQSGQVNSLFNISLIQNYKQDYDNALQNLNLAKKISEKNGWDCEDIDNNIEKIIKSKSDNNQDSPRYK